MERSNNDDPLLVYSEMWRELEHFLSEIVMLANGEYPQAQDFLDLLNSIKRKYVGV